MRFSDVLPASVLSSLAVRGELVENYFGPWRPRRDFLHGCGEPGAADMRIVFTELG